MRDRFEISFEIIDRDSDLRIRTQLGPLELLKWTKNEMESYFALQMTYALQSLSHAILNKENEDARI